jgi:AcrR family transcriptional regulator
MIPDPAQAVSTDTKILDACDRLFYPLGLRAVSLDQVASGAGLTKRTLYYHFKSKDDLIAAWLQRRTDRARADTAAIQGSARERLQTAFDRLLPSVSHPSFRGCPFVNAVAEIADPDHPAVAVARQYKADRLEWFRAIVLEWQRPTHYAEILMTLWEGALARAVIFRGPETVREAAAAAFLLLDT